MAHLFGHEIFCESVLSVVHRLIHRRHRIATVQRWHGRPLPFIFFSAAKGRYALQNRALFLFSIKAHPI
jgi:hypothetical protein